MGERDAWVERTRLARGDVVSAADYLAEARVAEVHAERKVAAARKALNEAIGALARCAVPEDGK